jgi:two-component system sensor histidine kinase QseC
MKLSIRKFLLFNLLLAITATTSITAIGSYYLNQQDIQSNLDKLLMEAALSLQTLAGDDIKLRDLKKIQANLNTIPKLSNDYLPGNFNAQTNYSQSYQFQIWDENNNLILHSAHSPKVSMVSANNGFTDQYIEGRYWRVFTIRYPDSKLIFTVGEHFSVRSYLVHRIARDDVYILILTYPLSGLLIWFIIGGGLRSVKKVTTEVARRAADHLEPVDLEAVPTEIKPLVDELNKLFLRLKQAFEREQRFAADAAHELRTPLAALRTQAQVALKTTDQQERRVHLGNVIVGVDRCTHVIQQLLTLCRVSPESATLEDPTVVELPKIAAEVVAQLAPSAIDKQIDIELIADQKNNCNLIGNATGLYALIRNLVDNAIRYTPTGGAIKVIIDSEADDVLLKVIDNGPGIPAELRSRVFERFFRVLGTNTQGSGLGLAIVQQIVRLHKGHVVLGVPDNGIGLEIKVILPRSK